MSDSPDPVQATVDSLMQLQDRLRPVLEMVVGYRGQAVEAGFSDEAAEQMAVELHSHLLGQMFA